MTDTTAPDAITQADDIVTIDEIRAIFSSGTVPMEAAVAIQNATSPAALRAELREIAAHRRLAAHGAGEGLREAVDVKAERRAFETWWRAWCPDRDMPSVLSHIFDAWLARARTTPPTDAGSTTREGGEGVLRATLRRAHAHIAAMVAPDDRDGLTRRLLADCRAALATTSSPDASPDSGEAVKCSNSPDGRHQVDTSMEEGPCNCFYCGVDMSFDRKDRAHA